MGDEYPRREIACAATRRAVCREERNSRRERSANGVTPMSGSREPPRRDWRLAQVERGTGGGTRTDGLTHRSVALGCSSVVIGWAAYRIVARGRRGYKRLGTRGLGRRGAESMGVMNCAVRSLSVWTKGCGGRSVSTGRRGVIREGLDACARNIYLPNITVTVFAVLFVITMSALPSPFKSRMARPLGCPDTDMFEREVIVPL